MRTINKIFFVFMLAFGTTTAYSQCETYLQKGEMLFSQKQYEEAKKQYLGYKECKPNAVGIDEIIIKIDSILLAKKIQKDSAERELMYQNAISSAERNFNQRQYEKARQDYESALKLKPQNTVFINAKIKEIDRKISEPAMLYIYRKGGFLATSHKYNIFLDNTMVCESKNNLKEIVTVTTFGTQTISATIEGRRAQVQINFEPGGIYYVESSVKSDTRNTGNYKTQTTPVYNMTLAESIKKGTKRTQVGTKTEQVPITETYYTPILLLKSQSIGEREYDSIKDK